MEDVEEIKRTFQKVLSEEQYNAQLHEITSHQFATKICDLLEMVSEGGLIKLEQTLVEHGEDKRMISEGIQKVKESLLGNGSREVESDLGKLGYLSTVLQVALHQLFLHIPAHVLLPEDECHMQPKSPQTDVSDTRKLFSAILEEKQLGSHLDARLNELKDLKAQLTDVKSDLQQVKSGW